MPGYSRTATINQQDCVDYFLPDDASSPFDGISRSNVYGRSKAHDISFTFGTTLVSSFTLGVNPLTSLYGVLIQPSKYEGDGITN